MKYFFLFILIVITTNCSNKPKQVYWCGDHPCVNKKEREQFFKKNMIVEVRNFEESKKYLKVKSKQSKNKLNLMKRKNLKKIKKLLMI